MTLSTDEIANKLENTLWSNDFSYQQFLILSEYLRFHHVQANSIIYKDGDEGLSMAILIKGHVRVCKDNKTIADFLMGVIRFCMGCIFDRNQRQMPLFTAILTDRSISESQVLICCPHLK